MLRCGRGAGGCACFTKGGGFVLVLPRGGGVCTCFTKGGGVVLVLPRGELCLFYQGGFVLVLPRGGGGGVVLVLPRGGGLCLFYQGGGLCWGLGGYEAGPRGNGGIFMINEKGSSNNPNITNFNLQ